LARDICREVILLPAADLPAETDGRAAPQVLRHRNRVAADVIRRTIAARAADLVHVEGFYLMQHVAPGCGIPVLLAEQNIESALWHQRADLAGTPQERHFFFQQAQATEREERAAWQRADGCAALTHEDASAITAADPGRRVVRIIPDGCDHTPAMATSSRARTPSDDGCTLVMVGNFGYQPNVDAGRWLCEAIFPAIRRRVPRARLLLVGTSPPPELLTSAQRTTGVTVTGRVAAVEPYLDAAAVVMCPLRIGGGIKVKLLEALRRGKPIVSTSVGLQGFPAGVRSAVRLADDPQAFAQATCSLLQSRAQRQRLAAAARAFSLTLPTWGDAATKLADTYSELLQAPRTPLTQAAA